MIAEYIDILPEVQNAMSSRMPIVSLESTILAHGMPYPQNLEVGVAMEKTIRSFGAIPATITALNGRVKVGIETSDMEYLAQRGTDILKLSAKDLPFALIRNLDGATTVAATAFISDLVGIKVFATGGIGGVHRFVNQTWDVSADLIQLSKSPVAVVCAGMKSILDMDKTMEYLETAGVPVLGYQTDELPAFYTRKSGIPLDKNLRSPDEVAEYLKIQWSLGLDCGVIIANPIPKAFSMDPVQIEGYISTAIEKGQKLNISGSQLTPFLLAEIERLSKGSSLEANRHLALHNAKVAAQIATAYYDSDVSS